MQKLREKKPLLVEQAYSCMDRFVLYSVSVEEVAEEVREGLADKNPTMKLQLLAWLERFCALPAITQRHREQFQKLLLGNVVALASDNDGTVRERAIATLSKLRLCLDVDAFERATAALPDKI